MFDDTCVMMMNIEDTTNDWHEGIIRNVLELLNDDASVAALENGQQLVHEFISAFLNPIQPRL